MNPRRTTISLITNPWSIFNSNVLCLILLMNSTHLRGSLFLPGSLLVSITGYGVPFVSYYMLVILIDLHKQLLFAAGKDPARSFSDI